MLNPPGLSDEPLFSDICFIFAPYLYQHLLVDNVTLNKHK